MGWEELSGQPEEGSHGVALSETNDQVANVLHRRIRGHIILESNLCVRTLYILARLQRMRPASHSSELTPPSGLDLERCAAGSMTAGDPVEFLIAEAT